MNHRARRWLLHDAVERLEPDAHSEAIREHVRQQSGVDLPLVRIYVDLERLVTEGYLFREKRNLPTTPRTTFFWETTGKVLVSQASPDPKTSAAAAPLNWSQQVQSDAVAGPLAEASVVVHAQ